MKEINNKINNNRVCQAVNGIIFVFKPATSETQTTDVNYVPLDSNYYQNILSNMAKNNYFSETINVTNIKMQSIKMQLAFNKSTGIIRHYWLKIS